MLRFCYILLTTAILLTGFVISTKAQSGFDRIKSMGSNLGGAGSGSGDSIKHRTGLEDSITIHFRYLDSSRLRSFDSALYDFTRYYPAPWTSVNLGNIGTASRDLIYTPIMQSGWDHGFHSFDVYNFTVENTRFYTTTRPYSELDYVLGSRAEQMIHLKHTQNIKPNWNMGFEYRLINGPGLFKNQNTNHNNYRFHSWYQSKNKRYQNFFVIVGNKLQASENGGILGSQYLDSTNAYSERSNIPTKLGPDEVNSRDFFNVTINTGSFYTNATYMMRQQYDLGQKDSLVKDTVVIPLFYPRLRLEHTISYSTYKYRFRDFYADSASYLAYYNVGLSKAQDTFFIQDHWKKLVNDFSIYQFPDAKNAQQFVKVGITLENLSATFDSGFVNGISSNHNYHNLFLHGEYRNKTRNQKWDIEAFGRFYVNGINTGDYNAFISLKRLISKKLGYLEVGFQNTNRTPSYVFNTGSSFYLGTAASFNKENITQIFGSLDQPRLEMKLSASYYLVSNMAYFTDFYEAQQASSLFNVLQINAEKQFHLAKHWNWRTWITLQQRAGDAPLNLPLFTTRNQFSYDGNLGFKNLLTSIGLEMRYFSPYDAPNYSPLTGQYFYQNDTKVKMRAPDIAAYVHFRIKTFNAYVRVENLNTFDGSGFSGNNVPTINYPYPGAQIRIGFFWSFIN
ncbi:MAG: hypothetical protein QM731_25715 [Chitinophagaceae bacterium]